MKSLLRGVLAFCLLLAWPVLMLNAEPDAPPIKVKDTDGNDVVLYEQSYALVIGISHYTAGWPDLPGVQADVQAVEEILEKHNFKVVVVKDPTASQMARAFDDFIARYGRKPNDRLLFYFAGHGHTVKRSWGGEMGYIVPTDAPNPNRDPNGFLEKAMDMQQIEVYAKRFDSKHGIFIFDSCFSGSMFATSRAVPESISYKTANPVRQFITAGSADEQVPDESVFRKQLVAALQGEGDSNHDGYVTGSELGEFLQDSVINYSKNMQHPQYGKIRERELDKGDFVFPLAMLSPPPPAPVVAAPMPPPPPVLLTGNVQINVSAPQAIVYFNDKYVGTASPSLPLNQYNVPTGPLSVRVEAPGYQSETKQIEVRLQQWTQVVFLLAPELTSDQKKRAESDRAKAERAALEARVNALLTQARSALAEERFTAPEGDNAIEYAQQVLDLVRDSAEARQVINETVKRGVVLGETALKKGDLVQAKAYHEQSRVLKAKYPWVDGEIAQLGERIGAEEQRLAALERQKAEQAALEARVKGLLEKGRKALAADRLSLPAGDNAMECAEQVLALVPEQGEAKELIRAVIRRAIILGETALKKGDLAQAGAYHEQLQVLVAKYPGAEGVVAQLGERIGVEAQRVAELERQKTKQATLEARVKELLGKGQKALAADRLSLPAGDNAMEYAEQVLELIPGQGDAKDLIRAAIKRALTLGEAALKKGDLAQAKAFQVQADAIAKRFEESIQDTVSLAQRIAAVEQQRAEEERRKAEQQQRAVLEAQIKGLLKKGRKALAADRLSLPAGNNAVEYTQQILALMPGHSEAKELIRAVIKRAVTLGEIALKKGDLAQAKALQVQADAIAKQFEESNGEIVVLAQRIATVEQQRAEEERSKAEQQQRAALEARIKGLLEKGRKALAADRLSLPAGDNAVEYAQQVLASVPGHSEARELIRAVIKRAVTLGEAALKKGDLAQARTYRVQADTIAKQFEEPTQEIVALAERIGVLERQRAEEERKRAEQQQQQAALKAWVKFLLERGRKALAADRLSLPAGDNAVEYAQQVLALVPGQSEAKELIRGVIKRAVALGEAALKKGDLAQAKAFQVQADAVAKQFEEPTETIVALAERISVLERQRAEEERRKAEQQQRAALEARIKGLLEKGRKALAADRLSLPAGDNAVEYAQQVQALMPGHSGAKELIQAVIKRAVTLGETALNKGDLAKAKAFQIQADAVAKQFEESTQEIVALAQRIATVEQQRAEEERRKAEQLQQQAALEAWVKFLLERGRKALAADRLSLPAGDNAVEYAQQVLALMPGQAEAKELINAVIKRALTLGEVALKKGDPAQAKAYHEQLQALVAKYPGAESEVAQLGERVRVEVRRLAALERQKVEQEALEVEVKALLEKGQRALVSDRLTLPPGDNAVQYAERVLGLVPGRAEAKELINAVIKRALSLGEEALRKGDLAQAKASHEQLRALVAKYPGVDAEMAQFGQRITAEEQRLAALEQQLAEQKAQDKAEQDKALAQDQVPRLIQLARKALEANRLTTPARKNAVEYAAEALQLQPGQTAARQVLIDVVDRYVRLAEEALKSKDVKKAQRYQETASSLVKEYGLGDANVVKLSEQIAAEQQRQTELVRQKAEEERRLAAEEKAKQSAAQARIEPLLEQARQALVAGRLTHPAGDNAVDYASQVLKLQPRHPEANKVLSEVVGRHVVLGEVALSKGQLAEAKQYLRAVQALPRLYKLPDTELKRFMAHISTEEKRQAAALRKPKPAAKSKEPIEDEFTTRMKEREQRQPIEAVKPIEPVKPKEPKPTGPSEDEVNARMKELEARQKELARKEEELRKRQEVPPVKKEAPPKREKKPEVFIPPAF